MAVVAGCKPTETTQPPTESPAARTDGETVTANANDLKFTLNGKEVALKAEPRTTLAELLRLQANLTGTKVSCDRGSCGACMVLVDGTPHNSCMMLAHDVDGLAVETVEGLGSSEALSPIQQAFVEHDALQCGFCTSGMVVSAEGLLRRTRGKLSTEEVKAGMAGNLCRCGTYPHVIAAIQKVAEKRG